METIITLIVILFIIAIVILYSLKKAKNKWLKAFLMLTLFIVVIPLLIYCWYVFSTLR